MVACMLQAASALYAQQPDKSQEINLLLWEENLEQLAVDEDYSWEAELEELSRCLQEPVNLNTATREQLEQFPFLSDLQVENLLAYVYIHGQMQTVYELQLVEEMDKRTIELLLPFVCVRQTDKENRYPSLKKMLKYGRHEVLTRLDIPFYTRKGYEKNYLGPLLTIRFVTASITAIICSWDCRPRKMRANRCSVCTTPKATISILSISW